MGLVRLLLAISVVLAHSSALFGTSLVGGQAAVECFFVISGFYMAMVLERKYFKLSSGVWRTFMASRMGRLLPVYLIVLLAAAVATVLAPMMGKQSNFGEGFSELSVLGIVVVVFSNLTLIGQDFLTFTAIAPGGFPIPVVDPLSDPNRGTNLLLVPQAWSVSVEILFYLFAPFLLRLSTRGLAIIGAASIAIRLILVAGGLDFDPWTYRFFPAELLYFVAGAISYRLWGNSVQQPKWLGAALVMASVFFEVLRKSIPYVEFVFPLLFAVAVPYFFGWTSRSKVDRWVGELSYPLYIVHVLVAKVIDSLHLPVTGLTLTATSLVAAVVLLVFVDAPIEKIRQRKLARLVSGPGVVVDPSMKVGAS
jgi:peptidoglycan/LPS O-acetylase OafA/YrhL